MFLQVLVDEKIESGKRIIEALRRQRFSISSAFWCRMPESGYWRLVIASPMVDRIGPLAGYRSLNEILRNLGIWKEFSGIVSLLSPKDPTFINLLEYSQSPGQFQVPATQTHNVFQDAYVYQI